MEVYIKELSLEKHINGAKPALCRLVRRLICGFSFAKHFTGKQRPHVRLIRILFLLYPFFLLSFFLSDIKKNKIQTSYPSLANLAASCCDAAKSTSAPALVVDGWGPERQLKGFEQTCVLRCQWATAGCI